MDFYQKIAQKYIGSMPTDMGCKNWSELRDKMASELHNHDLHSVPLTHRIRDVVKIHTEKLDNLKENRSNYEQLGWNQAETDSASETITALAGIISDINKILNSNG